jgi:photosystem II stability/assembly factor-like uncharacterized protein
MRFLVLFLLLAAASAQQWTHLDAKTTASLRGLGVVSDQIVWASGTEGTVIRTVDGGKTWSVMTVAGGEKLDFRGIHAFDANTAVIISSGPAEKDQAHIYRTTDAGRHWSLVYERKLPGIFFDAIAFWDHKHGIVLSDPVDRRFALFTTEDGGANWKQVPPDLVPPALSNEGAFAASNSCLAVEGKSNVWFATGGAAVARVFRSKDRGQTWAVSDTPLHPTSASSGIFSLQFSSAKDGLAAGGDYQHPESSKLPNLILTTDGGHSWQPGSPTDPTGIYFSSAAREDDLIFAAGIKGLWTYSGEWKQESTENLNTVVAGRHTVWAVGPKGVILKSGIAESDESPHLPM